MQFLSDIVEKEIQNSCLKPTGQVCLVIIRAILKELLQQPSANIWSSLACNHAGDRRETILYIEYSVPCP